MIFGMDVGTRRVALACPDDLFTYRLSLEGTRARREYPNEWDAGARLGEMLAEAVYARYGLSSADHEFFAERPFPRTHGKGANPRTSVGQALSLGAIATHLPGRLSAWEPRVWKKELLGNGNAGKDHIRDWLTTHRPALAAAADTQDELDAFCIGTHGLQVVAARPLP